jgi:beta-glucanase (GH16 family)
VRAGALRRSRLLAAGIGVLIAATVAGCSSAAQPQGSGGTAGASPAAPGGSPSASPHPVSEILGERWTQVWTDTFNGPAGQGINTSNWQYNTGHNVFGTGEVETATDSPANIHLDGHGDLDIIPLNQGSSWTSGRIQTTGDQFAAPAGGEMLVTASIKQPDPAHGTGYWPGFWLIGPGEWPEHGEIDIMEDVNASNQVGGTMHCGNLTQPNPDGTTGPCHENTGLSSGLLPCPGCDTSYHTYSLIIDRRNQADQQIRWYVDGHQFFSVSESRVGAAAWDEAVDHGFSIILDIAIGGGYPNVICHCTSPTSETSSGAGMSVAYASVYTN